MPDGTREVEELQYQEALKDIYMHNIMVNKENIRLHKLAVLSLVALAIFMLVNMVILILWK